MEKGLSKHKAQVAVRTVGWGQRGRGPVGPPGTEEKLLGKSLRRREVGTNYWLILKSQG